MFLTDGANSISNCWLHLIMRTAVSLVFLLLMTPLLGGLSSAEMTTDETSITVTGTETWNASNPIDRDLTILDGGSLFIDDATTVVQGVTITVEEGASLTVNGDLLGDDYDAGLLIYNDTEINLNFGDVAETGQVRINLDHVIPETAMFNITIGDETRDAVGSDYVDIPAPLNGTPLVVEFYVYYFFASQVTSVQALHSGSSGSDTVNAEDLDHTGGSLKWNSAAFTLNAHGSVSINNATIGGADLTCAGSCSMNGATATGSAPIHVTDSGSLSVDESMIQGSRTDEDIIVHDTGDITYTDSSGTGGFTDAWIRLLSQRALHTNSGNITVHATGLGYYGSTVDNVTNEDGHVNYALSEHARIVEWVDGDGVYHKEDAEILLTLSSSWGNYATTIVAPMVPLETAAVPLPYIDVISIDMEDNTGYTNMGLSGDVVIENSGEAGVSGVSFWCYVGDELQDTSQLTISLEPGETKTIYVTWRTSAAGVESLECKPLIPNVLKSITADVSNTNGATSQEVSWSVAEETEDQPWIIFAMLLVVVLGGAWVVSNQATKSALRNSEQEVDESAPVEKSYLEDNEVETEEEAGDELSN